MERTIILHTLNNQPLLYKALSEKSISIVPFLPHSIFTIGRIDCLYNTMKPRKDGGQYEGKENTLICRQQGKIITFT